MTGAKFRTGLPSGPVIVNRSLPGTPGARAGHAGQRVPVAAVDEPRPVEPRTLSESPPGCAAAASATVAVEAPSEIGGRRRLAASIAGDPVHHVAGALQTDSRAEDTQQEPRGQAEGSPPRRVLALDSGTDVIMTCGGPRAQSQRRSAEAGRDPRIPGRV